MVPFKQTSVKLKQIVHAIRWVFGALQRELCHIYPQDGENEKSSRWAESSNLLPTEHPRPLEVSPPTRKSKTCVQEKENIGVLSNPKTLVKNKITWVKVVGRNGGSRRWHKEGGSWLESGSHSRKLQWSRNRLSMALDGFWDSPKRALPYLPPSLGLSKDGINEKSSRWVESPNSLPTEHPRPLEVSLPIGKSKTCVKEKENIGVLSCPKTPVKNKITRVKVVGRSGGSREMT